tara:strand:- start:576 stop:842 length:267 start_codon:yes stop_codon:yes gene_type:complete
MNSPTTKPEVYKALSQLTAVITGGKFARATKDLESDPCQRIEHCHKLTLTEQAESFGNQIKSAQIQRKVDSLNSLHTLARLVDEVEWD